MAVHHNATWWPNKNIYFIKRLDCTVEESSKSSVKLMGYFSFWSENWELTAVKWDIFLYFSNIVTMDTNSYFPIAFKSSFAFSVFWLLNYAPRIDHEHWLICDMSSTSQCLKITKKVSFYNYIYVQIKSICKIVKKSIFGVKIQMRHFWWFSYTAF